MYFEMRITGEISSLFSVGCVSSDVFNVPVGESVNCNCSVFNGSNFGEFNFLTKVTEFLSSPLEVNKAVNNRVGGKPVDGSDQEKAANLFSQLAMVDDAESCESCESYEIEAEAESESRNMASVVGATAGAGGAGGGGGAILGSAVDGSAHSCIPGNEGEGEGADSIVMKPSVSDLSLVNKGMGNYAVDDTVGGIQKALDTQWAPGTVIGQSVTGQSLTGQSVTGQSVTGQWAPGTVIGCLINTGQSLTGQSVTGQSLTGQSVTGQSVTGQSVTGQSVTGQSLTGQSVTGQSGSSLSDRVSFFINGVSVGATVVGATVVGAAVGAADTPTNHFHPHLHLQPHLREHSKGTNDSDQGFPVPVIFTGDYTNLELNFGERPFEYPDTLVRAYSSQSNAASATATATNATTTTATAAAAAAAAASTLRDGHGSRETASHQELIPSTTALPILRNTFISFDPSSSTSSSSSSTPNSALGVRSLTSLTPNAVEILGFPSFLAWDSVHHTDGEDGHMPGSSVLAQY